MNVLDDILKVGGSKPLGYLPLSYIRDNGFDVDNLAKYFHVVGLKTRLS